MSLPLISGHLGARAHVQIQQFPKMGGDGVKNLLLAM